MNIRSDRRAGACPSPRSRTLLAALLCSVLLAMPAAAQETAEQGAAPACAKGEEAAEGACYPKCKDGFKGEGKLCKQICPERTQDMGNHCLSGPAQFRKKFYERAAVGTDTTQQ